MKAHWIAIVAAGLVATIGVAGDQNIVDVAVGSPQFSTLVKALQAAGLVDAVRDGELTVLAPTDAAFRKLPQDVLTDLLKPANKERLTEILTYHVIPGTRDLSALLGSGELETLQAQTVNVRFEQGRVRVNEATVQSADIACANGVIHVIDTVLMPPETGPANIVETAAAAGSFQTLLAAAKAAGLVEALTGEGPLTVFAPTDEAFARLPEGTVETLLKPENKRRLADILKYHVVSGKVTAGDALNAREAQTLNGWNVKIALEEGRVKVQEATVVTADLETANGLIHVIDRVMLPPERAAGDAIADALRRIEDAVDRGVPAFNGGDAEGCAAIYLAVSRDLAGQDALPTHARSAMKHALHRVKNTSCAASRAWILRHGLDRAYTALSRSMGHPSGS